MEGEAGAMELNAEGSTLFVLLLHQHNEAAIVEAGFPAWSVKLAAMESNGEGAHCFFFCFFIKIWSCYCLKLALQHGV
jgi:hypothetical protein